MFFILFLKWWNENISTGDPVRKLLVWAISLLLWSISQEWTLPTNVGFLRNTRNENRSKEYIWRRNLLFFFRNINSNHLNAVYCTGSNPFNLPSKAYSRRLITGCIHPRVVFNQRGTLPSHIIAIEYEEEKKWVKMWEKSKQHNLFFLVNHHVNPFSRDFFSRFGKSWQKFPKWESITNRTPDSLSQPTEPAVISSLSQKQQTTAEHSAFFLPLRHSESLSHSSLRRSAAPKKTQRNCYVWTFKIMTLQTEGFIPKHKYRLLYFGDHLLFCNNKKSLLKLIS